MAYLVAVGPEPEQRWRQSIPEGKLIRLGRAPRTGWKVPWDQTISREHADLLLSADELTVRCLDTARNPVFFDGEPSTEFRLRAGETFRIGNTEFSLAEVEFAPDAPADAEECAFRPEELREIQFGNAAEWLEALSELPRIISDSRSNEEFAEQIVRLALRAMPHAEAAAVMYYDITEDLSLEWPRLMRWESRSEDTIFRPSRRLIRSALETTRSVIHIWSQAAKADDSWQFTISGDLDWALCAPVRERACLGWCVYMAGRMWHAGIEAITEEDLKRDLRFTELLAQFVGSVSQVRLLERQHTQISQFFSPAVVNALGLADAKAALEPRESDISVLFCDVRGFSSRAEKAQHDLRELLNRTSDALGVMTRCIMKFEGVIADFQGDAALAFWGWPEPLADGPLAACRAAMAMQAEFAEANQLPDHSLAGFQVGIGIGFGRAIAGKIGSAEQSKVGVFGPVVNLASRLEGITKQFRVPILIDEATAEHVQRLLPRDEGRCRRLGRVRPAGIETDLMVCELLPPEHHPGTLSDAVLDLHGEAVDAFTEGRWQDALELFDQLPVRDRAKDLPMRFIAQHDYRPPDGWDGVIPLTTK